MISIEDTREDEEEIQLAQITNESKTLNSFDNYHCDSQSLHYEEEKNKIYDLNNPYVNQLMHYMENENYGSDISYLWLNRLHNVGVLAKSIHFINNKEIEKTLIRRDLNCEFKLIKLLTEDKQHRENLIKIKKTLNRNNRYSDLLPYAYNIATIGDESTQLEEENYINASYIDGPLPDDSKYFIATQGPLNSTIQKFWKLIFSKNIKLIIMLCNLEEDSRKKCEAYWPTQKGTIKSFENVDVYLDKEEFLIQNCLIKREFIVRIFGIEKRVTQLQMINWPDHMQPDEELGYTTIELILKYINEFKYNSPQSPILIHCSAGTGRTGTLIALHNIIRSFNLIKYFNLTLENKIRPFFSVFNVVRKLREQRLAMVSSNTQYKFIYEFSVNWLKRNFDSEY